MSTIKEVIVGAFQVLRIPWGPCSLEKEPAHFLQGWLLSAQAQAGGEKGGVLRA